MKRRSFVKGAGLGALAAAAGRPPAPAVARERIEWRMVTLWPRNFPGLGTGTQRIADAIAEMSGGRLTVKVYGAGELVPAYEAFGAVREGIAECMHEAPYIWTAKHPAAAFFCSVPGGLTPQEHNSWIYHGGGQALWDELYGAFVLRWCLAGNSSTNMGGWYRKESNSPDDFKGLRMRIPGLGAEVLARLGATTINISGGEILAALQTGVIDAAEWIAPYADLAFGLHKVAEYYYGPGVHEPGPANTLTVNREAYDALPSELRAIVRQAAGNEAARMPAEMLFGNAEALEALVHRHEVDVRHFPEEVLQRLLEVSAEVVAETAEHDELSRRIYDSWLAFRRKALALAPYSTHGYMTSRALVER
jgi:TRAP-type mannitol/chloroaromatic compound transport system substrate-binding protein